MIAGATGGGVLSAMSTITAGSTVFPGRAWPQRGQNLVPGLAGLAQEGQTTSAGTSDAPQRLQNLAASRLSAAHVSHFMEHSPKIR
jgi:hypothetical protein